METEGSGKFPVKISDNLPHIVCLEHRHVTRLAPQAHRLLSNILARDQQRGAQATAHTEQRVAELVVVLALEAVVAQVAKEGVAPARISLGHDAHEHGNVSDLEGARIVAVSHANPQVGIVDCTVQCLDKVLAWCWCNAGGREQRGRGCTALLDLGVPETTLKHWMRPGVGPTQLEAIVCQVLDECSPVGCVVRAAERN